MNGLTIENNSLYNQECLDKSDETMLPGWQLNTLTEGHCLESSLANKILHNFESLYAPMDQYLYAGGDNAKGCKSSTVCIEENL